MVPFISISEINNCKKAYEKLLENCLRGKFISGSKTLINKYINTPHVNALNSFEFLLII
ncbi:hypothetical protein LNTAR_08594 [Lentisphaera araneosa HTCC2155]|uniref:Uncharacterized protein n=1 Tax=Lentisphaera araneosa HTCC2155 TaxID=313628 RepID=A6DHW0_9BACT|nr:hypothetical protein LNTAR_08594 [Lentisphaera araneosa HTCC2155]